MKNLPNVDDLKKVRKNKNQEILKQIIKHTNELLRDTEKLYGKILMTHYCGETSFHEPIQELYRELMSEGTFSDYYHGSIIEMERQVGEVYCKMFNKKFGSQGYKAVRSGSIVIISWGD